MGREIFDVALVRGVPFVDLVGPCSKTEPVDMIEVGNIVML